MSVAAFLPAAIGAGLGIVKYGKERQAYEPRKRMMAQQAAAGYSVPGNGVMESPDFLGNVVGGAMKGMGVGEQLGMTNVGESFKNWANTPNGLGSPQGAAAVDDGGPIYLTNLPKTTQAEYYDRPQRGEGPQRGRGMQGNYEVSGVSGDPRRRADPGNTMSASPYSDMIIRR